MRRGVEGGGTLILVVVGFGRRRLALRGTAFEGWAEPRLRGEGGLVLEGDEEDEVDGFLGIRGANKETTELSSRVRVFISYRMVDSDDQTSDDEGSRSQLMKCFTSVVKISSLCVLQSYAAMMG